MHLFLQGNRGIGKSALLRQLLLPYEKQLSGFVVQRLFQREEPIGFRAETLQNGFPPPQAPYVAGQAGVFLLHKQPNISALEQVIRNAETDGLLRRAPLFFLDEIGGMEILSPVFMNSLRRILSSGKPCLGVWKSAENLRHMADVLRLSPQYVESHLAMEQELRHSGDLFTLSSDNREDIAQAIQRFLAAVLF